MSVRAEHAKVLSNLSDTRMRLWCPMAKAVTQKTIRWRNKGRDTSSLATRVIQIHFFTDVRTCGSSQTGVRRNSCSVAQVSGGRDTSGQISYLLNGSTKIHPLGEVGAHSPHPPPVPSPPSHCTREGSDLVQGGWDCWPSRPRLRSSQST